MWGCIGSTGRAKVQIIAVHKQKRDNREGYLSFVGGASFSKVEPQSTFLYVN